MTNAIFLTRFNLSNHKCYEYDVRNRDALVMMKRSFVMGE